MCAEVFTAPTSVDRGTRRGENSFFLGSYAAGYMSSAGGDLVPSALDIQKVTRPSMHILAGEMGNKGEFEENDSDKDDYIANLNPGFGRKESGARGSDSLCGRPYRGLLRSSMNVL